MEEKEFIIYQNKKGNIVYSLLSFILAIIAILSLFVHFDINIILEIIMKIILSFGVFFFGYAGIYLIRRMKNNKEMLIINNKGITDNSSAISIGFIPWEEIEDAYIGSSVGNEFIELKIKNEEKYLKNLPFFKKLLINANKKMGYEIVCITLNTTNYSVREVLIKINEYRNNNMQEK